MFNSFLKILLSSAVVLLSNEIIFASTLPNSETDEFLQRPVSMTSLPPRILQLPDQNSQTQTTNIQDFPDEILLHLVRYVNNWEDFQAFRITCHSLNRVANDDLTLELQTLSELPAEDRNGLIQAVQENSSILFRRHLNILRTPGFFILPKPESLKNEFIHTDIYLKAINSKGVMVGYKLLSKGIIWDPKEMDIFAISIFPPEDEKICGISDEPMVLSGSSSRKPTIWTQKDDKFLRFSPRIFDGFGQITSLSCDGKEGVGWAIDRENERFATLWNIETGESERLPYFPNQKSSMAHSIITNGPHFRRIIVGSYRDDTTLSKPAQWVQNLYGCWIQETLPLPEGCVSGEAIAIGHYSQIVIIKYDTDKYSVFLPRQGVYALFDLLPLLPRGFTLGEDDIAMSLDESRLLLKGRNHDRCITRLQFCLDPALSDAGLKAVPLGEYFKKRALKHNVVALKNLSPLSVRDKIRFYEGLKLNSLHK